MNIYFINRHFYLESNGKYFFVHGNWTTQNWFFWFLKIKAIKIDIVICFFFLEKGNKLRTYEKELISVQNLVYIVGLLKRRGNKKIICSKILLLFLYS